VIKPKNNARALRMYRKCAENVENYVKNLIGESTSALDLPQTHRRMLGVFKEKTRGSIYRETTC